MAASKTSTRAATTRRIRVRNETTIDMLLKVASRQADIVKLQASMAQATSRAQGTKTSGAVKAGGFGYSGEASFSHEQNSAFAQSSARGSEVGQAWSNTIDAEFTPLGAGEVEVLDVMADAPLNYIWVYTDEIPKRKVVYRSTTDTKFVIIQKPNGKFNVREGSATVGAFDEKEGLEFKWVTGEFFANDKKSKARKDLNAWTVNKSFFQQGWKILGHGYTEKRSAPKMLIVRNRGKSDVVRSITGWAKKWDDRGSGKPFDMGFFDAVAPSGYMAMGGVWCHAAYHGYKNNRSCPHPTSQFAAIKAKYVEACYAGSVCWTDAGTKAKKDCTVTLTPNRTMLWKGSSCYTLKKSMIGDKIIEV